MAYNNPVHTVSEPGVSDRHQGCKDVPASLRERREKIALVGYYMAEQRGLAYLLHVGSPQSKEGDDRKEEKIDRILAAVDRNGESMIKEIDNQYPRE